MSQFAFKSNFDRRSLIKRSICILVSTYLPITAHAAIRLHPAGQRTDAGSLPSNNLDWNALRAGDIVELTNGEYVGDLAIRAQGTELKPIIFRAAAGHQPLIRGSITFAGAAWVEIEGLRIIDSSGIAVTLREGAHHVTVRNNVIQNGGLGVWIGAKSAGNHRIIGNTITGHRTHGIAIDKINLIAGQETYIGENVISHNGHHGIEINGNYYIVVGNTAFQNGNKVPGTSGIHCYAKDAKEGTGCYNLIQGNVCWGQRDNAGPDGNGIQLDRWCDYNQVIENMCYDNDGAGISLFHAANNRVERNILHRNMLDVARSHIPRTKGELVITNDIDIKARVTNTYISENTIVARGIDVANIVFDVNSKNNIQLLNNSLYHEKNGPIIRTENKDEINLEKIEKETKGAEKNRNEKPIFSGLSPRTAIEFGLKLTPNKLINR